MSCVHKHLFSTFCISLRDLTKSSTQILRSHSESLCYFEGFGDVSGTTKNGPRYKEFTPSGSDVKYLLRTPPLHAPEARMT